MSEPLLGTTLSSALKAATSVLHWLKGFSEHRISNLNCQGQLSFQILTTHSWIRFAWKDSRLAWDPSEWNGIEKINIDASEVWIPGTNAIQPFDHY